MKITPELERTNDRLHKSKACRVVFRTNGRHSFGGNPSINYCGIRPPAPIHHIFTLDTDDKYSPLKLSGPRFIPLVYPLAYSQGGAEIVYRVLPNASIDLLYLSDYSSDDPKYFDLEQLPQRSAILKPLTYAERRISGSDVSPRSFLDRLRMRRLWNNQCFRVGGSMGMHGKLIHGECKSECLGNQFAYFPATQVPFGDIWHEYSWTVWFCFAYCIFCGTIHGYNECS
jgi:hypothetical protein